MLCNRLLAWLMTLLLLNTATVGQTVAAPTAQAPTRAATPAPPATSTNKVKSARERATTVLPRKHKFVLSAAPSDTEIENVRAFREPLVPMTTKLIPNENTALAKALTAYKAKSDPSDLSDLTAFLKSHPKSRWAPSLQLQMGRRKFEGGYLSDAISLWKSAWESSKAEKGQAQKDVADAAITELMLLDARLGRLPELENYNAEIASRSFQGASQTRLHDAREGIFAQEHSPQTSFKCGPLAVNTLLYLDKPTKGYDPRLKAAASTTRGTNLAQVQDWATQVGLNYQMAKRSKGAQVIVPSIMHWKLGHFAALTREFNGRYRVQDPTFDMSGSFWIRLPVIEAESDGYFLVPSGELPAGWTKVTRDEGENVWGKGVGTGCKPQGPGQQKQCTGTSCTTCPMAVASAWKMQADLTVTDTPVSYSSPVGDVEFSVVYSENDPGTPPSALLTVGPWWRFNWSSCVTINPDNQNATVYAREGGIETYNYSIPDNVNNPYPPSVDSQAELVIIQEGVYERLLPDGSIEIFNLSDGAGDYFMTQVIDPQGNVTTVNYSGLQITSITDPLGLTTTFNRSGNLITSIVDPFGRTAVFLYVNGILSSVTDAGGNASQFNYPSSSTQMSSMTTPYGTTSFRSYIPTGATVNLPKGLQFIFPDGTTSVIENWIGETKTTYFWSREAMALYPQDPVNHIYSHSENTKFLWDPETALESATVNFTRRPLESPIAYGYSGNPPSDFAGPSNQPTSVIRALSANGWTSVSLGGTPQPGDQLTITVFDTMLTGGPENVTYTVKNGDSISSIATGLANAINANPNLPVMGVSATATGTFVHLQSLSIYSTNYGTSVSAGATETMERLAKGINAKVGGALAVGATFAMTISDSALPGGQQIVSYTIQAGDNAATAAAALSTAINANTNLAVAGITSTTTSGVVTVQSTSQHPTFYTLQQSPGVIFEGIEHLVQTSTFEYNTFGYITKSVDPLGRTFLFRYSANNIDLLEIRETTGGDNFLIGKWEYTNQHVPYLAYDGSAQKTQYSYNSFGLPILVTDALNNQTTYQYSGITLAAFGGTVSAGVALTITVTDAALPSGAVNVQYTTVAGDTATSIASKFADLVNANANLRALRATASSNSSILTLSSSSSSTTYSRTTGGSITITLTNSGVAFPSKKILPLAGNQAFSTYTWASGGQLGSVGDSEGYVVRETYDALDRNTKTIYPDGTTEQVVWQALDPIFEIDRVGRTTRHEYDSMDQLVGTMDPSGRQTKYSWCACGSIASLTDPNGHITLWHHDLEGRVTQKVYPDSTAINYVFEPTNRLLSSRTDALGQTTNLVHNQDGSLAGISYMNAVHATPSVIFTYDPHFFRPTLVQTGIGSGAFTYGYTYNNYATDPFGTAITGGGRLATITNSLLPDATISFNYDALGRTTDRFIGSNNHVVWQYDSIGRVTSENDVGTLGEFTYRYVDDASYVTYDKGTSRLAQIKYPGTNGPTANFAWYSPALDERLKQINNLTGGSNPLGLSQFNYAYDPQGQITTWQQQQTRHTPGYKLCYDPAGQLVSDEAESGVPAAPNPVPPISDKHYFAYDPAANRTAVQQDDIQSATIGGTITPGTGTISITVANASLASNPETVNYAVRGSDNTAGDIAKGLAATITANPNLQAVGLSATASGATVSLRSVSPNVSTYTAATSGGATETVTFDVNGATENITIGGTGSGATINITVRDAILPGGFQTISYTDSSGQSAASIAQALVGPSYLGALPSTFTATQVGGTSSPVIAIRSSSPNVTNYTYSISGTSPTEAVSLGTVISGNQTFVIGGTATNSTDVLSISVTDPGLISTQTASYQVTNGQTATAIASGLATAINSNTNLRNIGITASSSGAVLTISSYSVNATSYTPAISSSNAVPSETITTGMPVNGTVPVVISATSGIGSGDSWTITAYDAAYGSSSATHTYSSGDTVASVAADLASQLNALSGITTSVVSVDANTAVVNVTSTSMNATTYTKSSAGNATLFIPATVAVTQAAFNNLNQLTTLSAGGATRFRGTTDRPVLPVTMNGGTVDATMLSGQSFVANPVLTTGINDETVSATAGNGTATTTNHYEISVLNGTSKSFSYDANGNMTNVAAGIYPQYEWDAENRLTKIIYDGSGNNYTSLSYDAYGRCVNMVESGTVPSYPTVMNNLQFIWCGAERCEARGATPGTTVLARYFSGGEQQYNGSSMVSYFSMRDHLGSVREMTDSLGNIQARYVYSPFGERRILSETAPSDFGFAGMYVHGRSDLSLALFRAYSAFFSRWLSRDPVAEIAGPNLYSYVHNDPVQFVDPTGLQYSGFGAAMRASGALSRGAVKGRGTFSGIKEGPIFPQKYVRPPNIAPEEWEPSETEILDKAGWEKCKNEVFKNAEKMTGCARSDFIKNGIKDCNRRFGKVTEYRHKTIPDLYWSPEGDPDENPYGKKMPPEFEPPDAEA